MTVYFAGTEPWDFETIGGTVNLVTNTSEFFVANSRCAVSPLNTNADNVNYVDCPLGTAVTEVWQHTVLYVSTANAATLQFFEYYTSGTRAIGVSLDSTGHFTVSQWNGSSWSLLATATTNISNGFLGTVDLHIKLGNPGAIVLYVNQIPYISITPNLSAIASVDTLRMQGAGLTVTLAFSEVILSNWNTNGSKIVSAPPTGNSAVNTAWTGDYTDVNALSPGAGTYISSATAGQREGFTFAAFPALTAGQSIAGIGIGISGFSDLTSPQHIEMSTRISSTNYDGPSRSLPVALTYLQMFWNNSPATGIAWTYAEANAAEYGVVSVA